MIHSPNRAIIDPAAIVHNLNLVKDLVGPEIRIMGVVKSDAYGHGLCSIGRVLAREGVYCLGVAHVAEALELRRCDIDIPIVVLCGAGSRWEIEQAVHQRLTPVIFDPEVAEALNRVSIESGLTTSVHIKVDTGMGRLGISPGQTAAFLDRVRKLRGLCLEALSSHLSSADEADPGYTESQIARFKDAVSVARSLGLELPLNNLANSAGVMAYKSSHFSMVRPGIMLYGGLPSPDFISPVRLKAAMLLKGRVLQVREFPSGCPISYGRTYYTRCVQKVAVLSAGYGDGLPRRISNKGKVLIGGREVPIVGRVCMNMLMADVSDVGDVRPGTEAVFLGGQGKALITGDRLAQWGGTISYEIFCSIGQRHSREYVQ